MNGCVSLQKRQHSFYSNILYSLDLGVLEIFNLFSSLQIRLQKHSSDKSGKDKMI